MPSPTSRRPGRGGALLAAVLTVLLTGAPSAAALNAGDAIAAPTLKAAFLYNFAKFSEWPADALAPGQRLVMCVVGDAAVADALGLTIKGRAIEGHELSVAILKIDDSARACHMLYVGASEVKRSAGLLLGVKNAPVFTVSDADGFAEAGGVSQLILENDRMRFAINLGSAQRRGLIISSKLLGLAKIVKGTG